MGGATRLMTLLTTPFTPLRPSLTLLRRRLSTTPLLSKISYPSKTKTITPQLISSFHSQPNNYTSNSSYPIQATSSQKQQPQPLLQHPWPEWNNFLKFLSNSPELHNVSIPDEDLFVVYEDLPDHFVRAASVCLAFAHERPDLLGLLSRRDVEAVVSNGTPFLFKSALDAASRMRAFLGTGVSEPVQATTVDLMKYILSYVSNAADSSERKGLYSKEHVDLSVRNLLHELGITSSGPPAANMPASDNQFPVTQSQTFRPLGQNTEMKRGDWICAKCNFMNFAKNMKCLECEESRPKRQLTGGEWDCPQCNFYNYGKNTVCIRCDCRRPGAPLPQTTNSSSGSGYNRVYTNTAEQGATGPKFSPFPQSGSSDSQYPQRSDGNKVLSSDFRNQPIHREPQVNYQVQQNSVNETEDKEREQAVTSDSWFRKKAEPHDVKDLPSAISDDEFPEIMPMRKGENQFVVSKKKDRSLTSPKFKGQAAIEQTDNSNFVPFVPFPPGYFSRKNTEQPNDTNPPVKPKSDTFSSNSDDSRSNNQSLKAESNPRISREIVEPSRSPTQMSISSPNISNNTSTVGVPTQNNNVRSSWEGEILEGSAVKEKEQAVKSDNWFKKIAELHDVKDLPSAVSDDEFPEIMPMRKGENQFVVSKKKDRSLSSPKFKRQAAMEQTNDSNFVPFVPFPPGYFSKQNTEQPNERDPPVKPTSDKFSSTSDDSRSNNQSLNTIVEPSRSPTQMSISSPTINNNTSTVFQNEKVGSRWEGKSLEGSAVKETNPLDMSEEAKAERWFKRVAQIKDISELSQIPDEDFPSIMPMRKGVNRFVVSKRKTPLERRLTSQQYRRNLPIVTNDDIVKRDT